MRPVTPTRCPNSGLTRAAALMYGPHGIRVNAVASGEVATGIPMPRTSGCSGSARLAPFHQQIPTVATAEQLAVSITFLLSDGGVNINGAILPVIDLHVEDVHAGPHVQPSAAGRGGCRGRRGAHLAAQPDRGRPGGHHHGGSDP